ncbi:MAG TPA: putative quinol monooxygenase [Nocardioides sp.]|nr:putative quinol monooxygenase [Nocardioides sp.]
MPKTAVIAKITCQPGKRDEVLGVFADLVKAVNDEPGTLIYAMNTDKADPDVVWFYELYTDDAALAAHSGSEAMKAVGPKLGGLLTGRPELFFLEAVDGKGLPD